MGSNKIKDFTQSEEEKKSQPKQRDSRDARREDDAAKKAAVHFTQATPARVEELIGRAGTRGEAIQVRCKILDGRDKNKIMRRNVKGPVRIGDMLMLRETEIEAQSLTQRRK